MYRIFFSKRALKEQKLLKQSGLESNARALLDVLANDPLQRPPSFEKLIGDFAGCYSRRINRQHRLVYTVDKEKEKVYVLSMWTHYE